jgi:hypothetical protein
MLLPCSGWRHTGEAEVQLHSFLPSALKEKLGGQLHAAAALTPGKYPLNRRPDGLQSWSGRFGENTSSLFRNSNPRIVQPVQKTHTKFWLSDTTLWSSYSLVNDHQRSGVTCSFHVQGTAVLSNAAARDSCCPNPERQTSGSWWLNEYRTWPEFVPTGVIWWPWSATPDPVMPTWYQSVR